MLGTYKYSRDDFRARDWHYTGEKNFDVWKWWNFFIFQNVLFHCKWNETMEIRNLESDKRLNKWEKCVFVVYTSSRTRLAWSSCSDIRKIVIILVAIDTRVIEGAEKDGVHAISRNFVFLEFTCLWVIFQTFDLSIDSTLNRRVSASWTRIMLGLIPKTDI